MLDDDIGEIQPSQNLCPWSFEYIWWNNHLTPYPVPCNQNQNINIQIPLIEHSALQLPRHSKWHWQEIIRYIKSLSLINYITPLLGTIWQHTCYKSSSHCWAPLRPRQSHQPVTSQEWEISSYIFTWARKVFSRCRMVEHLCNPATTCGFGLWQRTDVPDTSISLRLTRLQCTHDEAIQRCGATGTVIVEPPWYSHNQVFHCYRNHQPLSCMKIPEMSK